MTERRSLSEGIHASLPSKSGVDPQREREFVHGGTASPTSAQPSPSTIQRVPLSTRIRSDYAAALKRASLERQLNGIEPHTLQDILEQAVEPWLKAHGYLR